MIDTIIHTIIPATRLAHGRALAIAMATQVLLAAPIAAAAPPSAWSEDGSAEAATLRTRAQARGSAELESAGGTRGLVYTKTDVLLAEGPSGGALEPGASPVPPAPDRPTNLDAATLDRKYELERIAKRGRSYFIPGIVLSTVGTLFFFGSIAGLAKDANAVTGGLMGGSVALCAIGYPLTIVGVRMRKHPDRYLKRRTTTRVSPTMIQVRF